MMNLPRYDEWKTRLPEEQEPKCHCNSCGEPLYEGDVLFTIDGGICEECLRDRYRTLI